MATGSISSAVIARLRRDASDPDDTEDPDTGQKEIFSSYALLILILLLIVAFFTSYILRSKKIQAVHETVISIFAGMLVGLILRLTVVTSVLDAVSFDYQFFFNLLLPPIILASGYELHQVGHVDTVDSVSLLTEFQGKLLPQHWNDPHFRIRWNLHICIGLGCNTMAVDSHSARGLGHHFCRSHERRRNSERNRPCDHPRHLQHLQGRSQTIHHHLRRIHTERRHRHCTIRDGAEIQAWCGGWKIDNPESLRVHRRVHAGVLR